MQQTENIEKIFKCWVALSDARRRKEVFEQQMGTDPWNSSDSEVQAAWSALIDPQNLSALKEWGAHPKEMNEEARRVTQKAIELCRMKAESK